MVTAPILKICENLTKSQSKYCVLCLRTEVVRNLCRSSSLQKLIDVMNHRTAWSWKKSPFNDLRVCRVCEARMATAVKVMDAIKFGMLSSRLIEYYRANPNNTVEALDQYLVNEKKKRNKSTHIQNMVQPKHPMVHVAVECNSLVEGVRRFTALQVTETLCVSSGQGVSHNYSQTSHEIPQTKASAPNPLAEQAIDIIEHGIKVEDDGEHSISVYDDVTEHGVTVEDDKIDECEVLIENDIELPQERDIFDVEEETEVFVIEDDDDWVPNKTTKKQGENKNIGKLTNTKAKNKNESSAQPSTITTPPAINTVPIEKLLAPSGNSQPTFVPPIASGEAIVLPTTSPTVRNLVTPVGISANTLLNNPNPNATCPVFIPDCGEGQKLAVQCPESTNFLLHQIIAQPDGSLLVPSLPGRIVNGHLEIMQTPDPAILQQTTNSITIKQITKPTIILNGESNNISAAPTPLLVKVGSLDTVKKGLVSSISRNSTAPTPLSQLSVLPKILPNMNKFFGGVQPVKQVGYGVKRKTNEPDDSNKKKVEAKPPQPIATSVQPNQQPRTSFREISSGPNLNSSFIDWEDKIPMDVISYMDATDPLANVQKPEESQMGIISNVYSQKEVDDASTVLEKILRASREGSKLTSAVISID